jgi:hypothetical protein
MNTEQIMLAIAELVQERDALKLRLLETVNVFAKEFDRHRAECDTYQVEADKLAAENKVLRDAWSAEPIGYISEYEKDSAMDKFRYLPSKMYPTPVYTRNQS